MADNTWLAELVSSATTGIGSAVQAKYYKQAKDEQDKEEKFKENKKGADNILDTIAKFKGVLNYEDINQTANTALSTVLGTDINLSPEQYQAYQEVGKSQPYNKEQLGVFFAALGFDAKQQKEAILQMGNFDTKESQSKYLSMSTQMAKAETRKQEQAVKNLEKSSLNRKKVKENNAKTYATSLKSLNNFLKNNDKNEELAINELINAERLSTELLTDEEIEIFNNGIMPILKSGLAVKTNPKTGAQEQVSFDRDLLLKEISAEKKLSKEVRDKFKLLARIRYYALLKRGELFLENQEAKDEAELSLAGFNY